MFLPVKPNIPFLFFCLLLLHGTAAAQHNSTASNNAGQASVLLEKKIAQYKKLYPDMLFLNLRGGEETTEDMGALEIVLGYQPVSLDYEHPLAARNDLTYVSIERIYIMLLNRMPSASLFKADKPLGWQETVCVLTINPDEIAADALSSTGHLLNLPDETLQNIPHEIKLEPDAYLEFVIHHEIYHCLQSLYSGPQPMSDKELWAEYNHFQDELGADAYALAMHIKTNIAATAFAQNIKRIRGMTLYNADPDHLTCKALEQIMGMPVTDIVDKNPREILDLALQVKQDQSMSYDDYLVYLSSAIQAMLTLGIKPELLKSLQERISTPPDAALATELINKSKQCMAEISGN